MHLANFLCRQGGCTLGTRRTNGVGNGEGKSIWQGMEGRDAGGDIGINSIYNRNYRVVCRLSAASTNLSDELKQAQD